MTEYAVPVLFAGEHASNTNGFTIGKPYRVQRREGYGDRLCLVLNDNGHERIVDDGPRSPHLTYSEPARDYGFHKLVGRFIIMEALQ